MSEFMVPFSGGTQNRGAFSVSAWSLFDQIGKLQP
jgi:hypothetical protein